MVTAIVLASSLLAAVLVVLLIREIRIRRGLQFLLQRLADARELLKDEIQALQAQNLQLTEELLQARQEIHSATCR